MMQKANELQMLLVSLLDMLSVQALSKLLIVFTIQVLEARR